MDNQHLSRDDVFRLETVVRAAGRYVHPTDDLRPRTMEAARERSAQLRGQRRVIGIAATVMLVAATSLPLGWLSSRSDTVRETPFVAASDLQQQAIERAAVGNVDPGWALYEVFTEMRHAQADRLGASKSNG